MTVEDVEPLFLSVEEVLALHEDGCVCLVVPEGCAIAAFLRRRSFALMIHTALLAVACLGGCQPSAGVRSRAPIASVAAGVPDDGDAWMGRMRHRYSTCRTYRDMGVLRSKLYHVGDSDSSRQVTVFRTTFDRESSGFCFQFIAVSEPFFVTSRAAIWRETPGLARQWFSAKPAEVRDVDLSVALRAFAGISGGLTSLVPCLLLDNCGDYWRPRRKVTAGRDIEGAPTVEFTVEVANASTQVWLRESDAALVRLVERRILLPLSSRDLPPGLREVVPTKRDETPLVSEQTIDFYPVFDEAIHESEFRFSPPVVPLQEAPGVR